ncbi:uncharacterized protein LOC129216083 [Uloborus diversus]|uniref:uncharacterized protein LOC129216083 n=1 Tax=Uloborus diversus TaxID=327109 RepID=UPI002409E70A|nr:uncharacterized protein LOC129216083 [Uloborus diversus]XP_054706207.1 uncharacterized protein LOC129216083 [Uloborus diversus]
MARLAAYYQEDFHYTPFGYGPKQRKTYAVYEEPKFNNHFHNGYRLRELAASDPALSPSTPYLSNAGTMTLKQKSYPYESQFGRNSQAPIIEHAYENINFINSTVHPDAYENGSMYPHDGYVLLENHYPSLVRSQCKNKINKRLSYSETWDDNLQSPKNYIPRTINKYESQKALKGFDPYREEYFPANHAYVERTEQNYNSPVSYRDDSNHGKWQQWHWASPETYTNPALLSPPSPLDSGLSSQSITSSPSLEAEPLSMHSGSISVSELDRRHTCCCVENFPPDNRLVLPARMVASGRNSPGAYSTMSTHKKVVKKVSEKCFNNEINNGYHNGHVRYGMMGIIGEHSDSDQTIKPVVPKRSKHQPHKLNRSSSSCCDHSRKPNSRYEPQTTKSYKVSSDYTKPCVVITEASDKSTSSASSPDQDHSDKSPEPESSVSLAVSTSTSNSSSVASSNNELNKESELRKSKRAMAKEIRELEDMYKKCNLGDYELLERAERRDLPTPHQMKIAHTNTSNLTRSKSDTFYEMLGPSYRNPYENHQRTPPVRRSGIPDLIADDMALRKHYKPTTTASFNPVEKSITYMLCSSHFTPTVPAGRDILFENYPDVEYDDLSYRRHYFGKKSKIPDKQPPFGIPLRPPPPQLVYTDYLHAPVPAAELQPLCHPRGNPDVVRDDLAFRNLRKDEPERLYYDISQFYKKKRG